MRLNEIRLVWPLGAALLVALTACASKAPQKGRAVKPTVIRDVPAVLRGTIASEASLSSRAKPTLVSGFGLVVGMPGTGGGDIPPKVAASMERQLGLMSMNKASDALVGTIFEGKTPGQILRMKEVAVVIVYAQVAAGAPDGTNFDVYVTSVNKSPEISLEAGVLWTTDLHPGPPTLSGGVTSKPIARARGPIFINPFADPAALDGISGQNGRVLGGGTVTNSLDLELILDNESHSRASSMVTAINTRFPVHGSEPTARGKLARVIHVTVPPVYRDDAEAFLQTLMHIQIQQGQPAEFAKRYVEALKSQPALAEELSWCLQALPQKAALPFLRDLYDSTETGVRMAALRAGAGLGDALAAPVLKQLAREGPLAVRAEAVRLLGKLTAGPSVDVALKEQLESKVLSVRIAAYESLVARAEAVQMRRIHDMRQTLPPGVRLARRDESYTPPPAILELSGESLQGVKRRVIENKFVLDIVPSGEPLMYVTQRGRPRIVLFGEKLDLIKPCVVSAWNNRLMLACDSSSDDYRIYYKSLDRVDELGDTLVGGAVSGKAPTDVASLVEFLAHTPTVEDPRPGLGLSYSEVVGALYAIQQGRAIGASFAVEEDLEQAKLLAQSSETAAPDRPDTKKDAAAIRVFEPTVERLPGPPAPKEPEPMVVPLPQPVPKK